MFESALYPKTKQVLDELQNSSLLSNFYLAGGTALAIHLGHRKSVDLDFFTPKFPSSSQLLQSLSTYNPVISQQANETLDVYIKDVKVSFLGYNYTLLKPLIGYRQTHLAHVLDIACMKISAISSRGSKKDFVDLYFILKEYPLDYLLQLFEEKFKGVTYQKLHLLKSLVYFEDAESDPEPDYIKPISWDIVKQTIQRSVFKLNQ